MQPTPTPTVGTCGATDSGAVDVPGPGPRVAYLLLTHKDVTQVEQLARRILELSPLGHVVLHHDRKDKDVPWGGNPPDRARLIDRIEVEWGGWSIVEATLRLMREALEGVQADWLVVVSGEHWPVTDLSAWESELGRDQIDAYLLGMRLPRRLRLGPRDLDGNRFLARCILKWTALRRPRFQLAHRALAAVCKVSRWTHPVFKLEFSLRSDAWFVGVPRRRGPVTGWELYKGSEWFACNARAGRVLLATDRDVTDWYRHSHIPDESYFHSVLHRAGDLVIRDSAVTWVPPEPVTAVAGWMLLKPEDLPAVWRADVAFARKVDRLRNPDVIRAIDATVDNARRCAPERALEHAATPAGTGAPGGED